MTGLGLIFIFGVLLYGIYCEIKLILIGKGIIVDERFKEKKDLSRLYYKGIIFLILEVIILIFFLCIIFGNL